MGCGSRSECAGGLGGRCAKGNDANRRPVRHHGIDRFHPADKAMIRRDKDKFDCDQWTIDVVLALGDKGRIQCRNTVVVAMIDGASVFGRIIDDMPMDD